MNITVSLTDNSELVKNALEEQIEAALAAVGMTAETYAKELCPVDTGRLRNSITHETAAGEKAVYIGTNVEYAQFVEGGTSRMKARPYLRPAIVNHVDEYKTLVKQALST